MQDVFIEKIVPRKKSGLDHLKTVGIVIAYFVVLFLVMAFLGQYIMFLLPLLIFGGAWLVWMLITNMSKEHEYILTNGDLDIDVIIARRKRKRIFTGKVKDFEIVARISSDEYKPYATNRSLEVLDASSNTTSPNTWFLVAQNKGKRTLLLFEPDKRMMDNMRRYNPSRIHYNPMVDIL